MSRHDDKFDKCSEHKGFNLFEIVHSVYHGLYCQGRARQLRLGRRKPTTKKVCVLSIYPAWTDMVAMFIIIIMPPDTRALLRAAGGCQEPESATDASKQSKVGSKLTNTIRFHMSFDTMPISWVL